MRPALNQKLPLWGWLTYDFANSSFATTILAVIFNHYFAEVVAGGDKGTFIGWKNWGIHLPGATVWSFLVSFATALVAVFLPFLGSVADKMGWHKRFFTFFCVLGVLSTTLLTTVNQGDVLWGGFVFTLAFIGFSAGNVFYNSFLLSITTPDKFGRISGYAWGLGYLGGGLCLALNLIMLKKPEWLGYSYGSLGPPETFLVAGWWWGLFALPALLFLKSSAPSSEFREIYVSHSSHTFYGWKQAKVLFIQGWNKVYNTLKQVKKYRSLFRFLIAYLFYNDGVETIIVMASIYGAEVVGMSSGEMVAYFLFIQATAMVGSLIFGKLADHIGHRNTLLIAVGVWLGVVVWAYELGWVWDLKKDFYALGFLAGMVMGGSQSVSRSLQALLTPESMKGELFGFFALSGKASAVIGPLTYGSAIAYMGGVKPAIIILAGFFLIGWLILWTLKEPDKI